MFEKLLIILSLAHPAHAADIIPSPDATNRLTQALPGGLLSDTLGDFKGRLLAISLEILTALAIIMVIVAGYRYITSAGDPEKAKKARQGLIQTLAGIALFILVYFIINLIIALVHSAAAGI